MGMDESLALSGQAQPGPWQGKRDTPLARYVREKHAKNLETYRNDVDRVHADHRQESAVLEAAYRRRQVIELIQNAADALASARTTGRIHVLLERDCLYVANEGAELTEAGLRGIFYGLSEKVGKEIGRLGVGFKSVLEISSNPSVLSRSVSVTFSRERCIADIASCTGAQIDDVPVLTLAEVVDPHDLASVNDDLRQMMSWATTIIMLPIDRPNTDWLPDTLVGASFPKEFLLFCPQVSELLIEDRWRGRSRTIRCVRDGEDLELSEQDNLSPSDHVPRERWRTRSTTVTLSKDARREGGTRYGRPEVDLVWAVPLAVESLDRKEVWSFFPVAGVSTPLPGIINSGWQLSEDRGNLVDGKLNRQLLDETAQLVVSSITGLAGTERPGLVLDLLPPRPPRLGARGPASGWVGPLLESGIWSRLEELDIVGTVGGKWVAPGEANLWPEWTTSRRTRALADQWSELVATTEARDRWVHRSLMTERRVPRAGQLGVERGTTEAWLEAICSTDDPENASAAALQLVQSALAVLDQKADLEAREGLRRAAIVATGGGGLVSLEQARLDDGADESEQPLAVLAQHVARLQRLLGIASDTGERELLRIANNSHIGAEAARFWEIAHALTASRAAAALRDVQSLTHVPVRTLSGKFADRHAALLPGDVVDSLTDPELTVDLEFHARDDELIARIGLSGTPCELESPSKVREGFLTYREQVEQDWRDFQREMVGSTPQWGTAQVLQPDGAFGYPSHLPVLLAGSLSTRRKFTAALLRDETALQRWHIVHSTQRSTYRSFNAPSPTAWAIRSFGAVDTSLGPVASADTVSPGLDQWTKFLPVAEVTVEQAERLGLAATLEDVPGQTRLAAYQRAVRLADEATTPDSVAFLFAAANAGWEAPTEEPDHPILTTSPGQASLRRQRGERVWLCRSEHLSNWPEGWAFSDAPHNRAISAGEVEQFTLIEYFPQLAAALGAEAAARITIEECDAVRVDSVAEVFGRNVDALLIARTTKPLERLLWMIDELGSELPPDERETLIERGLSDIDDALVEAVRGATDLPDRLTLLLGESGVMAASSQLIPSSESGSAREASEHLLTVFGPAALREVRHLIPSRLGVPTRWAGSNRTGDWVEQLGFPRAYAGRRKSERPDEERVLGPVDAGVLHEFQAEIADHVRALLDTSGSGVIDLPTGAGKTRVAIESILLWAAERGALGQVLWVAEREELCEQAVTQWAQLWRGKGLPDREIVIQRFWGGRPLSPPPAGVDTVTIASRQQLAKRINSPTIGWLAAADVLLIDEAHHSTAASYIQIKRWREQGNDRPFALIGLTATPFRSDEVRTNHLARIFDKELVSGSLMGHSWPERIRWLQDRRFLSRIDVLDLQRGTVEPNEVEEAVIRNSGNLSKGFDMVNERLATNESRNAEIVETICGLDSTWQIVVFASSVSHAQLIATELVARGVTARPIWGELAPWARRDAIEKFRAGEIRVLTNFNVLSEGFDAPKTRAVVITRLVQSDGLFLQMLGRGMRGHKNGGTDECTLVTMGEQLPSRFDHAGGLDIERHEGLWSKVSLAPAAMTRRATRSAVPHEPERQTSRGAEEGSAPAETEIYVEQTADVVSPAWNAPPTAASVADELAEILGSRSLTRAEIVREVKKRRNVLGPNIPGVLKASDRFEYDEASRRWSLRHG